MEGGSVCRCEGVGGGGRKEGAKGPLRGLRRSDLQRYRGPHGNVDARLERLELRLDERGLAGQAPVGDDASLPLVGPQPTIDGAVEIVLAPHRRDVRVVEGERLPGEGVDRRDATSCRFARKVTGDVLTAAAVVEGEELSELEHLVSEGEGDGLEGVVLGAKVACLCRFGKPKGISSRTKAQPERRKE